MSNAAMPMSFRPSGENQKRLEYAKKLGVDVSKVVNEILNKHLRPSLEKVCQEKAKELRTVLDAPMP